MKEYPLLFHTFSWTVKGYLLEKHGKYEEAVTCFDNVINIDRNDGIYLNVWYGKGRSLLFLGKYEEALTCFDTSIKNYPNDSSSWFNKGCSLIKLGKFEESVICFDKAISLDPQHIFALCNKGLTFDYQHNGDEAARFYQNAKKLMMQKHKNGFMRINLYIH